MSDSGAVLHYFDGCLCEQNQVATKALNMIYECPFRELLEASVKIWEDSS